MNRRLSLTIGTVLTFALAGCGGSEPVLTRAQTIAAITGSAAQGKTAYENQCGSCHGLDGKGTSIASSLVASVKSLTAEAFINAIINGVSGTSMSAYGTLSDQEIANMYAHVKTTLAK
jgi:mono/diheme cytochrome c family protein